MELEGRFRNLEIHAKNLTKKLEQMNQWQETLSQWLFKTFNLDMSIMVSNLMEEADVKQSNSSSGRCRIKPIINSSGSNRFSGGTNSQSHGSIKRQRSENSGNSRVDLYCNGNISSQNQNLRRNNPTHQTTTTSYGRGNSSMNSKNNVEVILLPEISSDISAVDQEIENPDEYEDLEDSNMNLDELMTQELTTEFDDEIEELEVDEDDELVSISEVQGTNKMESHPIQGSSKSWGTVSSSLAKRAAASTLAHNFDKISEEEPKSYLEVLEHTRNNQSVWYYFLKEEGGGGSAKCKECQKILKTPNGSTTGMHGHLKTIHNVDLPKRNVMRKSIEGNTLWNFFLREKGRKAAQCHQCQRVIKTPNGCTTGLHRHLRTVHDIDLLQKNFKSEEL